MKFMVLCFLLLSSIMFAQTTIDCESIQCDCENLSEADKKLGMEGLCEYMEKKMIVKCKNKGITGLKCKDDAKGPNAWLSDKPDEILIEEKEEKTPTNNIKTFHSVEDIIYEIKNAKDPIAKYVELHSRLSDFKGNRSGLALAMEVSDLMITVREPAHVINFALIFAKHPTEYSEASIDLFLPRLITGFSVIEELEIEQLDMKYDLGHIFRKLKVNGYDLNKIFGDGAHYANKKVLNFVEDCEASISTNYSRKQMRDLREVSTKIYLRKLDALIPTSNKNKLAKPIKLISADILEWNENLIDASVNALEVISNQIETKNWNKVKISQLSLNYTDIYYNGVGNNKRYKDSMAVITKELPIFWDMMIAIFIKK